MRWFPNSNLISKPCLETFLALYRVWENSPDDFHAPEKDTLFHSPSVGSFLAGTSPFCLLRTCNTAACPASTRTNVPSSCAQDDPGNRWYLFCSQRSNILFYSCPWATWILVIQSLHQPQKQTKFCFTLTQSNLYFTAVVLLCISQKMSYPFHQESFS